MAAASSEWRTRLAMLFAQDASDEKTSTESQPAIDSLTTKNVMDIKDGHLFVWDHSQQCVLWLNLIQFEKRHQKQHQQQSSRSRRKSTDGVEESDADHAVTTAATGFQKLIPTCRPVYDIKAVVCNPTSQRLALVGHTGVNVVELPQHPRRTDKEWTSNAGRTLCSSVEMAERYFLCNPNCRVMRVKWHPASNTSTHLLILFSNNYLRVYDSRNPTTPTHAFQLGPIPVFRLSSTTVSSFGSALGETAVDFDFGRPEEARNAFDRKFVQRTIDSQALVWPVFILKGNGDVYSMWITDPRYSLRCEVKGPLTMHPPAEDNYGADACSILCLPCTPPILAIATCSGILYHCLALDDVDEPEGATDNRLLDASSSTSSSWNVSTSRSSQTLAAPDLSLYVYESIELELIPLHNSSTIALEGTQEDDGDAICPILLHKDPTTICRYHCTHVAGVNTVALPIVAELENFADEISGIPEDVLSTIESQTCIIEHLICTKPLPDSSPSPVIGLGVTYDHLLGGATLLCLVAPFDLMAQALVPTYLEHVPRLLTEEGDGQQLNAALVSKEPFDQHVRKILQRKSSIPVFKTNVTDNPNPEDCLQLLNRSTRILREEYIEKLDLARETIVQRIKVLEDLRAQQIAELRVLNKVKDLVISKADLLGKRYEDLQLKQQTISRRVENVLRLHLKETPELSDAERDMYRYLKTLEEKLKHFKNSIEQIRAKQDHHEQLLATQRAESPRRASYGRPTGEQMNLIKESLKKQSQELEEMTLQTNKLYQMLDMYLN